MTPNKGKLKGLATTTSNSTYALFKWLFFYYNNNQTYHTDLGYISAKSIGQNADNQELEYECVCACVCVWGCCQFQLCVCKNKNNGKIKITLYRKENKHGHGVANARVLNVELFNYLKCILFY